MVIAATLAGLVSCSSNSRSPSPSSVGEQFQARSIEIHPLSHIHIRPGDIAMVEVAVSVLDEDGLPVRVTGVLEVELHQRGRYGDAIMARQTWERDLTDPKANLRAFDATTRTYRATLQLPAGDVPRSPSVTARLVRAGRGTLDAGRSLEVIDASDPVQAPPESPAPESASNQP